MKKHHINKHVVFANVSTSLSANELEMIHSICSEICPDNSRVKIIEFDFYYMLSLSSFVLGRMCEGGVHLPKIKNITPSQFESFMRKEIEVLTKKVRNNMAAQICGEWDLIE